jgi:hypothetical protein
VSSSSLDSATEHRLSENSEKILHHIVHLLKCLSESNLIKRRLVRKKPYLVQSLVEIGRRERPCHCCSKNFRCLCFCVA